MMDSLQKPLETVQHWIHWTGLRSVGNSPLARLTIIIPLVGYLIIFNEYALQYLHLSHRLFDGQPTSTSEVQSTQISMRLLLIYFGLCAVALASAIYTVACPPEIKRHGSPTEYSGGDGQNLSVGQLVEIAKKFRPSNAQTVRFVNFAGTLADKSLFGAALTKFREQNTEDEVEGVRIHFEKLDESLPLARVSSGALYATGFIILAIPSLDVFWRVARLFVRTLVGSLTS
jgi:hypothetical protein